MLLGYTLIRVKALYIGFKAITRRQSLVQALAVLTGLPITDLNAMFLGVYGRGNLTDRFHLNPSEWTGAPY